MRWNFVAEGFLPHFLLRRTSHVSRPSLVDVPIVQSVKEVSWRPARPDHEIVPVRTSIEEIQVDMRAEYAVSFVDILGNRDENAFQAITELARHVLDVWGSFASKSVAIGVKAFVEPATVLEGKCSLRPPVRANTGVISSRGLSRRLSCCHRLIFPDSGI